MQGVEIPEAVEIERKDGNVAAFGIRIARISCKRRAN